MGVVKSTGFAAPYRSLTFRNFVGEIVSRNGLMAIDDDVSESAGTVFIPPFTANQQGLIYKTDYTKQVIKPGTLIAPYFLVVSAPTNNQLDDLVWSFAQRPEDVMPTSVLVAEWDGNEWRQLPLISIDEMMKAIEQDRVDYGWAAPVKGLVTTAGGGNYVNSAGVVVDKNGRKTRVDSTLTVPQIADDPEVTWDRVDRIVYRRPKDSEDRVGVRKLLLGGSYSSGSQLVAGPGIQLSTTQHRRVKAAVETSNTALVMMAEGFGTSFSLWLARVVANRGSLDNPATMISGLTVTSEEFDFAINPANGDCFIVYIDNGILRFVHTDRDAVVIDGPTTLDAPVQPCSQPRIVRDATGKYLVTYQRLLGPTNKQLYFTSCDDTGAVFTLPKRVTNTSSNIINQSMSINSDLILYLAYEEESTGKIFYDTLDDIGTVLTLTPVYVSASTPSTSFGSTADNASEPRIVISDSRDLFIVFKQLRGGLTGLVIWKNGTGYSPDLISPADTIGAYDVALSDMMDDLWVYASYVGGTERTILDTTVLDQTMVVVSDPVDVEALSVSIVQDKTGSLFLAQSASDPATYTNVGGTQAIDDIGAASLTGTAGIVNLAANQIKFTVASLTHTPATGESLTVAGATDALNNVAKIVTNVELATYNAIDDSYIVTLDSDFNSAQSPSPGVTAQFADPDGMAVTSNKTTAETAARASRLTVLPCDVLLSRILRPGPVLLNYVLIAAFGGLTDVMRFGVYGTSQIDWGLTTPNDLTINVAFGIIDLLGDVDYAVAAGSYPMVESDALYVVLDGANFNVTPIVTQISTLPRDLPIQVLGYIRGGNFSPVLLAIGGGKELSPQEAVVIGEDLPPALRTRIGFTSDTAFQAYLSDIAVGVNDTYPEAISNLDLVAGLNKNIKLVRGSNWSWTGSVLSWSADAFLQVTGLVEARNKIDTGSVSLTLDGQVAYVNVNRTGSAPASLTVGVAAIDALVPNRNTIVIARREGADVVVADTTRLAISDSKKLEEGGSGGGGSTPPPNVVQEEATYTGTPGVYTTSQLPLNDEVLFVWKNTVIAERNVAWTLGGSTITFNAGFIPDPDTQPVYVSYIVTGQSTVVAGQEEAEPVVGDSARYNLVGKPVNAQSTWVMVDGTIIDGSLWGLVQTIGAFQILFTPGNEPAPGQSVYVLYFLPNGVGSARFTCTTAPGSPAIVDPAIGVPAAGADRELIYIVSQGGQQDITALPSIPPGTFIGQELKLVGTSDTDYSTLHNDEVGPYAGSGVHLNGLMDFKQDATILLTWDGAFWNEDTRR